MSVVWKLLLLRENGVHLFRYLMNYEDQNAFSNCNSTAHIRLTRYQCWKKGLCETAAMSVQVVAAKMAEVELKDVPTGKDLPAESSMTPTSEGKTLARNDPHEAGFTAATSPTAEPSAKAGEGSLGLLTPNPAKMPQASAMKRTDPQQNGGEAFVNRDGTVAEAPRMKKVSETTIFSITCYFPRCYRTSTNR